MKRALPAAIVLAALGACRSDLTPVWKLTDFRVLGIRSDPPEAARGSDVQVTLAYADVRVRDVKVVWLACAIPISLTQGLSGNVPDGGVMGSFGGSSGCAFVTVPGTPIPDLGTTVTVHIPATGGAPDPSGNEAITLVGYACAGGSIGLPRDGGVQPTCNPSAGSDSATGWQFMGEIPVRPQNPLNAPNRNPSISEVRFGMPHATQAIANDSPPTVPACADTSMHPRCPTWSFEVGFTSDSREQYQLVNPINGNVETRTELLTTGYVVDRGSLAGGFRTDSTVMPMATMQDNYTAPAMSGDVHVFVYAIDSRGGFDWTERVLHVQ